MIKGPFEFHPRFSRHAGTIFDDQPISQYSGLTLHPLLGWIPGRVPLATFDDRIKYLGQLTDRKIILGNIPITRIDKDRNKARASINVAALAESSEGSSHWIKPPSGKFQTIEDLEGLLIVGNPDDCAVEIEKFRARGVEHLVFDLRLKYDRYEESLELIGKELLPRFR